MEIVPVILDFKWCAGAFLGCGLLFAAGLVRVPHTPPPFVLSSTRTNAHRKSFGRNIYKALLGISLVLALNYSLAVVYTSNLLHSGSYAFGFSVVRGAPGRLP